MPSFARYVDHGATYYLSAAWETGRGTSIPSHQAEWIVRSWAACPLARHSLRRTLAELDVASDHDLVRSAARALERGSLRMFRERTASMRAIETEKPEETTNAVEVETHDLNFTFQYTDGSPAGGIAYRFFDLDEQTTEATLGDDGLIDKHGVPAGTYRVELKEIVSVVWAEKKVQCGTEVALSALVSGYADGTAAKVRIFREFQEKDDEVVDEIDATVSGDRIECVYDYDYAKNDRRAGQQGTVRLTAEISLDDGAVWCKTIDALEIQLKTLRAVRWNAKRVHPAFDAEVIANAIGYPDGSEATIELWANHPIDGPTSLTSVTAPIVDRVARAQFSFLPSSDPSVPTFESGRIQHAGELFATIAIEDDVTRTARTDLLICDPRPAPQRAARS
jgi:hypothetical protein